MELLGLTEDELCQVLAADPLTLLSGQLEQAAELRILLDLLAETQERVSETALRAWVRATGPQGRPIDALLARDFARFEDALGDLEARGLVVRRAAQRPGPDPGDQDSGGQDSGSGGFSGQAPTR